MKQASLTPSLKRRSTALLELRTLLFLLISLGLLSTSTISAQNSTEGSRTPSQWAGQEDRIETMLLQGTVLSKERVGRGITNPWKVVLQYEGETFKAIFKPLSPEYSSQQHESHEAEIAAYRLSRHLGLNKVPPTVRRKIGRKTGSLQLWVNGYKLHADVAGRYPPDPAAWSQQLSSMKLFDDLIDNPDRHDANYLVGDNWDVVLIDHSRALAFDRRGPARVTKPPQRFDRALFENVRELDLAALEDLLGDLYGKNELRGILNQRRKLVEHVNRLVQERGEWVFFTSLSD